MELREFIAKTLVEIQGGVQDAIRQVRDANLSGVINPVWGHPDLASHDDVQKVNFDIAVTIGEKTSGTAQGGINVVGFKVGADGTSSAESSRLSRIQFTIPVIPPMTVVGSANKS